MSFTVDALNIAADAVAGVITHASLHSADPGANGADELTGGSYARQTVTFAAAANGEASVNNAPMFDVPPSATIAYVGFWENTTFRVGVQVPTETYSANGGTYQVQNTTKLVFQNQA